MAEKPHSYAVHITAAAEDKLATAHNNGKIENVLAVEILDGGYLKMTRPYGSEEIVTILAPNLWDMVEYVQAARAR